MADSRASTDSRSLADPSQESTKAAGRAIGRYHVAESLGTGGMGEVFRAYDPVLDRDVALKHCKLADSETTESLLREARLASQLQHASVVSIYDVFEYQGEPVIVQEFIRGHPLSERIRSGQPFSLAAFFTVAEECASALAAAEARDIVHCDLKPDNILLDTDGHGHILDFGIARTLRCAEPRDEMEESLRFAGTPAYMAPERIRGDDPTPAADIFSLGVVFYEMLTGDHPFRQKTLRATIDSVLDSTPIAPKNRRRSIPRGLDRVVMKMLAKEPALRYQSAADLVRDIQGVRDKYVRRRRERLEGAAVLGALATAVIIYLITRPPSVEGLNLLVQDFATQSPDSTAEFFAAGLSEAIAIHLLDIEGLNILDPRTEIRPDLKLEGRVLQEGELIRIHYRVQDSARGNTIAGDVIEGPLDALFALEDRVTLSIGRALSRKYGLHQEAVEFSQPTPDIDAYSEYLRGRGYMLRFEDEGKVDRAIQHFEKALAIDPHFALAMAGLGDAFWKRYEASHDTAWTRRAESISLTAAAEDSSLAEVHVTLGTIYQGTGRDEMAAAEFQRAIAADPKNEAAYRGLARYQESRGDLAAAEETYRKAIDARPYYWAAHNDLGVFYFRQGRFADARGAFERVVELTEDNARGYANLGGMNALLGQDSLAVAAYEKSIEIKPNFAAYTNLATFYRSRTRFAEAAATYGKALAINPNHYEIWGDLGAVCSQIPGREAESDSALARAIELGRVQIGVNPEDPFLLVRIAQYEVALGHEDEGMQLAAKALALAPDQPEVLWYAAGVFEGAGDRDRALSTLRDALEAGYPADAMRQETSLAELLADPRFEKIVREVEVIQER